MTEDQPRQGSSCFLQGCLFGAVGLFVVLLLVMLFLAFARFREHTIDGGDGSEVGFEASPAIPLTSPALPHFATNLDRPVPSDQL